MLVAELKKLRVVLDEFAETVVYCQRKRAVFRLAPCCLDLLMPVLWGVPKTWRSLKLTDRMRAGVTEAYRRAGRGS